MSITPTLHRTFHHQLLFFLKSLYFVSVHPMQKQQKPDIHPAPDVYAKTHKHRIWFSDVCVCASLKRTHTFYMAGLEGQD